MSLVISRLTAEHYQEWDEYVLHKQASIYHDSRWIPLIKTVFGHDSYDLMAHDNGTLVGILPLVRLKSLLFGNFMISMPYFNYGGAIADRTDILQALVDGAQELREEMGCSHIEMRCDKPMDLELATRTDKVTVLLDLPEDPDQLWQLIGSKRRAQIKRPLREGVTFHTGGGELLEDFYYVFSRNMRDLGTPVYSKRFFQAILKTFNENAFIAIVRLNGEAVGAGFLIGNNGRLEIPWASTLRKVNRIGVNMFLYWNILKTAIEKQYRVFDFGRSSKDAGTLKFKKQWGGSEHQLYWYYLLQEGHPVPELNPSNRKFETAIAIWRQMPLSFTNRVGPLLVKNLP